MLFKGIRFRQSKSVCILSYNGNGGNYVVFGRILSQSRGCPQGAQLLRNRHWYNPTTGAHDIPVYAKLIPLTGYSRTNLAYGADGRCYLAYEGFCYQSAVSLEAKKVAQEVAQVARANRKSPAKSTRSRRTPSLPTPFEIFRGLEIAARRKSAPSSRRPATLNV